MVLLLLCGAVAVTESAIPAKIIFWIMAAGLTLSAGRSLTLGVTAREDGILVRELLRTTLIPWAEVETIELEDQSTGLAGLLDAEAPTVTVRMPDGNMNEIELNVLGTYRFLAFLSPGRRAVDGLKAAHDQWRAGE
ncbi:PH domain-containing protein [Micromonospora radicis]|uniref:PH domain-containing protein n=1 Tax=Micromonospora radicis TaxID=1894971 RepID=UPI0013144EE6|nr:PH domain-containing protein [Micromonospora radicis]